MQHGGESLIFEVKEFDGPLPGLGFGYFDPHRPIREKIHAAKRKFKEYKHLSCSLVLANPKPAFVRLDDPITIIGAMLGNVGFTFIPTTTEPQHELEPIFLGGGKMVSQTGLPQNTTISSVIALHRSPVTDAFDAFSLRAVVFENPFARIPLRRDIFCGPMDERWGLHEQHMQRLFAGRELPIEG